MAAIKADYRKAALSEEDRGILDFAHKLTLTPWAMCCDDVDALRRIGLSDADVHDVVQVAALFNYYDRLADGLGIEPEPEFTEGESRPDGSRS